MIRRAWPSIVIGVFSTIHKVSTFLHRHHGKSGVVNDLARVLRAFQFHFSEVKDHTNYLIVFKNFRKGVLTDVHLIHMVYTCEVNFNMGFTKLLKILKFLIGFEYRFAPVVWESVRKVKDFRHGKNFEAYWVRGAGEKWFR